MKNISTNLSSRKSLLITLVICIILVPLILLLISQLIKQGKNNTLNQGGTQPTAYPSLQRVNTTIPPTYAPATTNIIHKHLTVISTSPSNNETGVSPNLKEIKVVFDQPITVSDVPFAMAPNIFYTVSTDGDTLFITPKQTLTLGETYNLALRLYDASNQVKIYSFEFTITGPTPTLGSNQDIGPQLDSQQRINDPDIYLANQTPFSTNSFTVTSNYTFTPTGHFYFDVTLTGDQTTAKNNFLNWMKSLQLTDQQIQNLDIRYQ